MSSTNAPTPCADVVLALLNDKIKFQKHWKRVNMVGYIITTSGTIMGTTLATVFAAAGHSYPASICAAAATILVSIEKSLLLREKWKFHLRILTRFEAAKLSLETSSLVAPELLSTIQEIMGQYAKEVPITAREESESKELSR